MKLFKTRKWIIVSFSLFFLFISHLSSWAVYLTIKNETKSLNIQALDIDVYKDSRNQKMQSKVLAPGDKDTLSWTNAWLNWECNDGDTWYSNLTIQVVSKEDFGSR